MSMSVLQDLIQRIRNMYRGKTGQDQAALGTSKTNDNNVSDNDENRTFFKNTGLEAYLRDEKFLGLDVLEGEVVLVDARPRNFENYYTLNVRILMGDQLDNSERNITSHFRGLGLRVYYEHRTPLQGLFLECVQNLTDRDSIDNYAAKLLGQLIDYQQRTNMPLTIMYAHGTGKKDEKKHYMTIRDKDFDTEEVLRQYATRFFPGSQVPVPVMLLSCNENDGYQHEFQEQLPVALLYRKGICGRTHITGELATTFR